LVSVLDLQVASDRCNQVKARTLPRQFMRPGLRQAQRIMSMSVSCL
jgi:hypothetical protein